jgi:hypothetical protein
MGTDACPSRPYRNHRVFVVENYQKIDFRGLQSHRIILQNAVDQLDVEY